MVTGMPDSNWPPKPRAVGRALRAAAYGAGSWAGLTVVLESPGPARLVLGGLALAAGVVGTLSAGLHNWMVEWPAAWVIGGTFLAYAAIYTGDQGVRAVLVSAAAAFFGRGVELWVFSLQNRRAARRRGKPAPEPA